MLVSAGQPRVRSAAARCAPEDAGKGISRGHLDHRVPLSLSLFFLIFLLLPFPAIARVVISCFIFCCSSHSFKLPLTISLSLSFFLLISLSSFYSLFSCLFFSLFLLPPSFSCLLLLLYLSLFTLLFTFS